MLDMDVIMAMSSVRAMDQLIGCRSHAQSPLRRGWARLKVHLASVLRRLAARLDEEAGPATSPVPGRS